MRVGNGRRLAFNATGNEANAVFPLESEWIISGEDILTSFQSEIRFALEVRCSTSGRMRGTWLNAELWCFVSLGLSCGEGLRMRCGRKIQRGILLNFTGLQRDLCDVEACHLPGLNVYKLSGVETPRDPLQRARQSICSGGARLTVYAVVAVCYYIAA